jgi:hypothetical protein
MKNRKKNINYENNRLIYVKNHSIKNEYKFEESNKNTKNITENQIKNSETKNNIPKKV